MIKCNICAKAIPNDSEFCPFCGGKVIHIVEESLTQGDSLLSIQPDVLIKRAFLFVEEGNFDKADNYIEAALNQDPENAEAYLAKLLIDLRIKAVEELSTVSEPFADNVNCKRAIRYGDEQLKETLVSANSEVVSTNARRKEEERIRQEKERNLKIAEEKEKNYQEAKQLIKEAQEQRYYDIANEKLTKAKTLLVKIPGYKNTLDLYFECEKL